MGSNENKTHQDMPLAPDKTTLAYVGTPLVSVWVYEFHTTKSRREII